MEKQKALLLFSGGYDSVVLLHDIIDNGYDVHVLYVKYGQRAQIPEENNVMYWVKKFGIQDKAIGISLPPISWSKSTLGYNGVSTGNEHKDEYVEMRNLIFLSYATSYAQAEGIQHIFAGFIHGEHYDDTNPIFVKLFDSLVSVTTGSQFHAPYVHMNKVELTDYALGNFPIDVEEVLQHSITCNVPVLHKPCGKCEGCKTIKFMREKYSNHLV